MLIVDDVEHIRWLSFSRPRALNALTRDDIREASLAATHLPGDVRALVFTGAGARAFSAGVHVGVFQGLSAARAREFISALGDFLGAVRRAEVPTLCAVNGYCLGAAMELAVACDLRVASTNAIFGMPEIKVGIPSVLDAALLQQHLGLSKAKEMMLTGDLYPAAHLERYGFLNRLVSPDHLRSTVEELARAVSVHSPVALAAQKRLFETWQNVGLQEGIQASVSEFAEVFSHPETLRRVADYQAGSRRH